MLRVHQLISTFKSFSSFQQRIKCILFRSSDSKEYSGQLSLQYCKNPVMLRLNTIGKKGSPMQKSELPCDSLLGRLPYYKLPFKSEMAFFASNLISHNVANMSGQESISSLEVIA